MFFTTPPMPTYRLAFVVSDLTDWTEYNDNGFRLRVLRRSQAIEDTNLAINISRKSLLAYKKYYDIVLDISKVDLVVLPGNVSGIIRAENFGLCTLRESDLLFNASHSTFADKRRIGLGISQAFAQQYVGNLVTPEWWSYAWLSEGLAHLFGYIATDWVGFVF